MGVSFGLFPGLTPFYIIAIENGTTGVEVSKSD